MRKHISTFGWFVLAVAAAGPVAAQTPGAASAPTIAWQNGPLLELPRDHHATFLVRSAGGDFLYIAGGTNYKDMYDDIVRARIRKDGSLGAFESAGKYPVALGGTSVAVAGNFAVLTGGQIATAGPPRALKRVAHTYVATIDAQGKLGAWKAAPALPAPRFHHPSLYHNGWVYVVGGQGEKEAEAGIFAAQVAADGTIVQWTEQRPLPRPRSHHAVFVVGGFLYVVGGLDGAVNGHGAHFTDVIRSKVADDGSLGEWQIVSRTPHAYATHAAFAHDGFLWVLGGVEDGNRFVDHVWRAELRPDGRVGEWQEVKPGLPIARGHVHNTPVINGRLYSVGGRITPTTPGETNVVTGASHVGTFIR